MNQEFPESLEFNQPEREQEISLPGNLDDKQREELRDAINDFKDKHDIT